VKDTAWVNGGARGCRILKAYDQARFGSWQLNSIGSLYPCKRMERANNSDHIQPSVLPFRALAA
jgi:hypothetical protein